MLSYPTPDVYWQDVFPTPEPTFLTGVPVFLGHALSGPINEPTALYLWPQFEAIFGQPYSDSYLAYAVRGFFENGGLIAYVVRLDDDDALPPQAQLRAGLAAATELDTIDLIYASDIAHPTDSSAEDYLAAIVAMQTDVLDHCQQLGNRFALLDTPLTTDNELVLAQSSQLNSSYGALYHPWLLVSDGTGGSVAVPPGGHVAGIYSRSDQQAGVHKAPANEVLNGVVALQRHLYASAQRDFFAGRINTLRAFTGRGIRVWGARTLSRQPEWQQVSLQRLFITIGRWLEQFMSQLLFEANTPQLWVRINREVSVYLNSLFQQGAFQAQLADHAFYVKCDAETNPPAVREAGMVVTEIGIAAAQPAEFVVVRVIHGSSGVSITTGS